MLKYLVFIMLLAIYIPAEALAQEEAQLPVYKIQIKVDPSGHRITGEVQIALSDISPHNVYVGGLKVNRVFVGGKPVQVKVENGKFTAPAEGHIAVEYEASFKGNSSDEDIQNVGVINEGMVGEEGVSLTGLWYPIVEDTSNLAYYRLTAVLPEGYKAISEADNITETPAEGGTEFTFLFTHPVGQISLAAGKYVEKTVKAGDVDIFAYFFQDDEGLAQTYLDHAVGYIKMYEELIGPYPYKRFSVVENFLPTGYSFPTYTLLGQAVVRLPFIVKTSLGHEVLHQWFGNSVYVDFEKGNWSEGVTSYLADQHFDALEGKGPEHRKNLLLKCRSFIRTDNDFPLRSFFSRSDFASAAVGYAKGAMVFHMLRDEIGDEAFFAALGEFTKMYEFKNATWDDLRLSFETASGQNLGWFFKQWVDDTGALSFRVSDAQVTNTGTAYHVELMFSQKDKDRFHLPVRIIMQDGTHFDKLADINKEKQKISVDVPREPKALVLDPDYDLMRGLSLSEAPPVIAALLGAKNRLVVLSADEDERARYAPLAELLEKQGFTIKEVTDVKDADIRTSSVLVTGPENQLLRRLYGYRPLAEDEQKAEGFTLETLQNPLNPRLVVVKVRSSSAEETGLAAPKIFRYSTYSNLSFLHGKNVKKERGSERMGIHVDLEHTVMGIAPSQALTLDKMIHAVTDKPVIYVGEGHPNYEDHKVQLRVIEALQAAERPFAVGMEMFQRPFQAPLDDYIAGKTSERQFLKDSEYYKRWKYNYYLYREILEYCRTHGIPVVALNLKGEIVRKVSRNGLDSLDADERALIPEDMDMSDVEYENSLRDVFGQHDGKLSSNFEDFYQAQVLWDETMAHTVAEHLKEHPDMQMVIIAGAGHVVYGYGIPKRVNRLTGLDYATLVPSTAVEMMDSDVADFIYYAEPIDAPEAPQLGVMIEQKKEGLAIKTVAPGSLAEKAGMQEGDVFVTANDQPVKGIDDLRIALFGKQEGDTMKLKIKRKRFLFGYKDMEMTVKF